MEIDYKNDVLELSDGTPVTFLRANLLPWQRFRFNCAIHYAGAVMVHQFDLQGHSRDMKTKPLRAAMSYTRWDLFSIDRAEPVATLYQRPTRKLLDFEYVVERQVDVRTRKVTVDVIGP